MPENEITDSPNTPAPQMVTLSDGTALATWSDGAQQDLPPVVLLHGGPGLWDDLAPLADLLTNRTLVHRFDQRGCGRSHSSSEAGGEVTVARLLADLEELRRHWDHESWVVIGHSFGADLALLAAAAEPERISAVCYLSGTGIGDWHTPYRAERDRRNAPFAQELADQDRMNDRSPEQEITWRTLTWASDFAPTLTNPSDATESAPDSPARRYARALAEESADLAISHELNRRLPQDPDLGDPGLIGAAARCTMPAWFVHGAADPRPVGPVVELAAHAQRARKRIVEDAGHRPWTEQPERTREILLEVLHSAR